MRYFICYKPYGMLSQFTAPPGKRGLGELFAFPRDVYPLGRLDEDSEGLLLLTDDKRMNALMLGTGIEKEYLAQVEGIPGETALAPLHEGIQIRVDGALFQTRPAQAQLLDSAPDLPPREPPIRFRASVPTSWLRIVLREGKNRQVRKMTAAVGFPTLRLVRVRVGTLRLGNLLPGEVREVKAFTLPNS